MLQILPFFRFSFFPLECNVSAVLSCVLDSTVTSVHSNGGIYSVHKTEMDKTKDEQRLCSENENKNQNQT